MPSTVYELMIIGLTLFCNTAIMFSLDGIENPNRSGCKFLTKPLRPEEIPLFQRDLKALLQEVAPLKFENLAVD